MAEFNYVVCGGTFDLFHKGHEELINKALSISKKILIGITSDTYIESFKKEHQIEDFSKRKKSVKAYLKKIHVDKKVILVPINSAYEPYLETSKKYDAIVVSNQTKKTAILINKKRKQNNLIPLTIIIVPDVSADDKKIISSTRIRHGEINRKGKLFIDSKWKNNNLVLPINLRKKLQVPWGKVLETVPKKLDGKKAVVVGDYTALEFNKNNLRQFLSVIDFLINREKKFNNLLQLGFKDKKFVRVRSDPGIISKNLFKEIENAFKNPTKRKIIVVDGEEDLAVLPVILLAPLEFSIFYGQPKKGMVEVLVTEEVKEKAYKLLDKFIIA